MNCPYCGSPKAKPIHKHSNTYQCPVCKYRFEPSLVAIFLDRYFSFPFSSFVLAALIFGLVYLFSYYTLPNGRDLIDYLLINILMTIIILILLYFATTERRLTTILGKKQSWSHRLRYCSPILKVIAILIVVAIALSPLA